MRRHAFSAANLLSTHVSWAGGASADLHALRDRRLDAPALLKPETDIGEEYLGELILDLLAPTPINCVALLGHDLRAHAGSLLSVSGDDGGTPTVLKSWTEPASDDTLLCFGTATYRYFRLSLVASGPFEFHATEAFFGVLTPTTRAVPWGQATRHAFRVSRRTSRTGLVEARFRGGPTQTVELPFEDVTSDAAGESDDVLGMWMATSGGRVPLLWASTYNPTAGVATEEEQACLYGRLSPSVTLRHDDFGRLSVRGLELEELPRGAGL